ncbi:hypothetical protein NPIL_339571 [Nephila pilipes]|uniref:Uncharacterized protein n=1 Tax=Nephila pilipes TaxID=299642 RepID=A0A8X6NAF6_NEPPI|nr:hypothetical protein NPIL_339571 [Nephila pilipes]
MLYCNTAWFTFFVSICHRRSAVQLLSKRKNCFCSLTETSALLRPEYNSVFAIFIIRNALETDRDTPLRRFVAICCFLKTPSFTVVAFINQLFKSYPHLDGKGCGILNHFKQPKG